MKKINLYAIVLTGLIAIAVVFASCVIHDIITGAELIVHPLINN